MFEVGYCVEGNQQAERERDRKKEGEGGAHIKRNIKYQLLVKATKALEV